MHDSPHNDPSLLAYKQCRRAGHALDNERVAGKSYDEAFEAMLTTGRVWDATNPSSDRGVAIKLRWCVLDLQNGELNELADTLREFFRMRNKAGGDWLRDLRTHIEIVKRVAPECEYAVECLKSILAGMAKPVMLN